MTALVVVRAGPQSLVEDLGRPGHAGEGVPPSGTVDPEALRLANRLVGNPPGAAGLELLLGGVRLEARGRACVAVTGAAGPLTVTSKDGRHRPAAWCAAVFLDDGDVLELGAAVFGIRYLVAVRGGLVVPRTLGSAAADVLSGLGPAPLRDGDVLGVGAPSGPAPAVDVLPVTAPPVGEVLLRIGQGPRRDWFADHAWRQLLEGPWTVSGDADRVGLRLDGPQLERTREGELPSEGVVTGALQVPPGGRPVLFLADHPTTGGYPVIAVVAAADLPLAGQLRPGQAVAFVEGPARRTRWRTVGPRLPPL
jgi:biotin-dependent carboxylase-like uncharacterized protein